MRLLRFLLLASCLLVAASPAFAAVPQTIVVDGVNDFDPSNLVDDDRGDTEIKDWCPVDADPDSTMDLGRVYLTNDATHLFIGFDYFEDCFGSVQLGIAIDVDNTPAGGTDDPFTRKVGWSTLTNRPDAYVYLEQSGGNYEIFYRWNGTAWADSTTLINPAGAGSNALGASDQSRFVELKIPLSALRATGGQQVNVELWMTQNSANKGPLDASCSDGVQMSLPSGTTFDTPTVVQMTCMHPFTLFTVVDVDPPTVVSALAVNFQLLANQQFGATTNKIDVLFSEPVGQTTANVAGNYLFGGPVSRTVIVASRDAITQNLVHLLLNSSIQANSAFYNITVSNVKDMVGNTIVANGSTNVGSFFIQNADFAGNMKLRLCKGEFAATDSFYVEGSLAPLTFSVGDNARLLDANSDSVYTGTVPFCLPRDPGTGKAEADLEWKLSHTPSGQPYEPLANNRFIRLSSDSGSTVTLSEAWGDDAASNFTDKPIDVIFRVNANAPYLSGPHKLGLTGSEAPLSFDRPGLPMRDDGVFPDGTAGDGIFAVEVRFPGCTPKTVYWKAAYDSIYPDINPIYECDLQGNRDVYLNTAVFDTVGGALGPLALPARGVNRCTVTDKAVTVVYSVSKWPALPPGDTVAVMGSVSPLVWERPLDLQAHMNDAGTGFDAVAGDFSWTTGVTFPDSSNLNVEFKYWHNGLLECFEIGNRTMTIDDVSYSTATPQVRVLNLWDYCSDATAGVQPGAETQDASAAFAILRQSFPNPMSPRTTIHFDLKRAGEASLTVYDVTGRRVATLLRGALQAGPHEVQWNGRDDNGNLLRSGVYLYELAMGKDRLSRRIALMR